MGFMTAPAFAHELIRKRLRTGEIAVDGTAGNGIDTVFLARQTGARGRVYAFDIQQEALERTRQRLQHEGFHCTDSAFETADAVSSQDRSNATVCLIKASHAELERILPDHVRGHVAAAMFNFGYLPGGDTSIITRTETSLLALKAALNVLKPGGIMTAVLYPGHAGGDEEAEAVEELVNTLPTLRYDVIRYGMPQRVRSPFLLAVEKRKPK